MAERRKRGRHGGRGMDLVRGGWSGVPLGHKKSRSRSLLQVTAHHILTKDSRTQAMEYNDCYLSKHPQYKPLPGQVSSGNKRRCGGGVIFERWWDLLLGLVVAGQAVNTGLDQDQTELGVLVLPVGLEVLANSDGLLYEVPEVLRDGGSKSYIGIKRC